MNQVLGRYKNGNYNVVICDDGTKFRLTEDDEFRPEFAENIDIKITDCCDAGCPYCHEGSSANGRHGNLNHSLFDSLHPFQEVAIGGGNILSHPDLLPFLVRLKNRDVIANITVNQVHFEKNFDFISYLHQNRLVKGIGISLKHPTPEFIAKVKAIPNTVIHTINGVLTPDDFNALADNDLKVLILGYKTLRRGVSYSDLNHQRIISNQLWLKNNLASFTHRFKLVSFDNLAIEQLDVRSLFKNESDWDTFYMGDDGTSTFYIDLVNEQYAKSSTEPLDKRRAVTHNVDQMFKSVSWDNLPTQIG